MQNHFDVIIVGGGITGNASALSLAQCGLRVALLSNDQPTLTLSHLYDSRIYALSHNSVQLLKNLRVWDALRHERICTIKNMHVMGDTQQGLLNFDAVHANQSELAWIVEQNNIQMALIQAIQFSPNISVIKAQATRLEIHKYAVSITTNQSQTLTANLLIGSDGSESWVRQTAKIDVDVFDYELDGVVANFNCVLPHQNTAYQWFLPNAEVLALLPLPNQAVSMVYSCTPKNSQATTALSPEDLARTIQLLTKNILGNLTAQDTTKAFSLKKRRAKRFIAERIILVGDAAHTVHPLAGQGLNLGLQDVSTLRDLIMHREPFRSIDDSVILRRYERNRAAATFQMQGVTHALNRLFMHEHPTIQHTRNLGMNVLNAITPLKRWLIKAAMAQPHSHQ